MPLPCIINDVVVGAAVDGFTDDTGAKTITNGIYRFDEFVEAFLDVWSAANRRFTLRDDGHVQLDNNGGGDFSITFDDPALMSVLGFNGNLAGSNLYISPQKIRCGWHAVLATLRELHIRPAHGECTQELTLGLVPYGSAMPVVAKTARLEIQFMGNAARLVSPSGASGTTYAALAASSLGLTEYAHMRDFAYDDTDAAKQGFGDGRRIVVFEDQGNSGFTMNATDNPAWEDLSSELFSQWVLTKESRDQLAVEKSRAPMTHVFDVAFDLLEYREAM